MSARGTHVLTVLSLVAVSAMAGVAVADWPQHGHDDRNSGVNPDGDRVELPAGPQWVVKTGSPVQSSPAVANGTVYLGTDGGRVMALDAATGEGVWSQSTHRIKADPTVTGGTVYVGGARTVYAIDAASGVVRWKTEVGVDLDAYPGAAVHDGVVYAGTRGRITRKTLRTIDRTKYPFLALDAEDGEVVWRRNITGGMVATPAVTDERVVVATQSGAVASLDPDTGREQWRFAADDIVAGSPAMVDGTVYVGSHDRRVYALDAASGEPRWSALVDGAVSSSPVATPRTVVVGDEGGAITALDTDEGAVRWRFDTGSSITLSAPALTDDTVYVGTQAGELWSLNASSGRPLWNFSTGSRIWTSPAATASGVYVANTEGDIYAITEKGPNATATVRSVEEIFGSPGGDRAGRVEAQMEEAVAERVAAMERGPTDPRSQLILILPLLIGMILVVLAGYVHNRQS